MPTYVYGCDTCGHRFEIFQKFQDMPLTECPQCGARVRRIFQPAGIVFKGSGWYSKDSRASGKSATTNGSEETAKTETAAKTNGEAKPESASKESTTTSTTPAKEAT
jgi:putative FmdB family regulatory protein